MNFLHEYFVNLWRSIRFCEDFSIRGTGEEEKEKQG